MMLYLFVILCTYCFLLLKTYRLHIIRKDYSYISKIGIRCGSPISMWNRYYLHNQSDVISGLVVDSVDEEHVQDHYAYLLQAREKSFENVFMKQSNSRLSKIYNKYAIKVNDILQQKNNTFLAKLYHSLRYKSSGNVCDGCYFKQNIKTFTKTPKNEQILRKFVGNKETLEIYMPYKRNNESYV